MPATAFERMIRVIVWPTPRDMMYCIVLYPEFDRVFSVLYSVYSTVGRGMSNSGTLASDRQDTASLKYNDDICLLISQYLISLGVGQTITLIILSKAVAGIAKHPL
jgi:hypothetical protein